ncbi:hypothetical protein [Proteiniclasticum ruminis]|uniref:Uncharacterized protein n=1 Tax=Proteiniclasticum ruminis TaxID=398199 RepID=A0A1I4Y5Z9_9CLOT|nr:hypothetical protein [Proteiniclasticum ruminis]SFN32979.1 hypothetical protein SAMN04488695_101393 [Proteiniclasticum ruminis]
MNAITRNLPMEKLLHDAIDTYHSCVPWEEWTLPKVSILQKMLHERKLRKLLEKTLKELPDLDETSLRQMNKEEKDEMRAKLRETAKMLDQEKLLYSTPFLMEFMNLGFLESTEEFFERSQSFEPEFKPEDLFQAVRNVWIMNCLQLLFHNPVCLTSSIFSYSLLYPYTDNYLDDPNTSSKEKSSFNHMIYQKILGNPVSAPTPYEAKVCALLDNIEKEFPRDAYPSVYESLWYIQDAQSKSILQCNKEVLPQEILHLSFYKGGASVLADACLVKGNLSPNESTFAFGYGTFLQLLDDLQDRMDDASMNHQTLYSGIPVESHLDEYIEKLLRYIDCVLGSFETESNPKVPMNEVIRSCMRMMVESVVGKHPSYVSKNYYKSLESYSSVRLSFYPEMEKIMEKALRNKETQNTGS